MWDSQAASKASQSSGPKNLCEPVVPVEATKPRRCWILFMKKSSMFFYRDSKLHSSSYNAVFVLALALLPV